MALLFTSITHAAPTDAEKETARSLMNDGDRLRAAQDLPSALQRYQAAHEIMKVPTTGIEVAKTYALMGKLVEARRASLEVANLPPIEGEAAIMGEARQEASSLAAGLAARIPSALVQVWPKEAQARITVDGVQLPAAAHGLPYKTNPGAHVVQVSAPGYQTTEQEFRLEEGSQATVQVNLVAEPSSTAPIAVSQPAPQPSSPPPSAAPADTGPASIVTEPSSNAYVAFGIAGAGALAGSVTGVLSLGKASAAKENCDGNRCTNAAQDDIDSAKTWATFSNIGFGVAIVAGAWGLYEVLTASGSSATPIPSAPEAGVAPEVSIDVAPGQASATLQGVF